MALGPPCARTLTHKNTHNRTQWVVGLPLSWLLAFPRGMGEWGLWGGLIIGAGLQAVVLLIMLSRWDWNEQAARVRARLAAGGSGGGFAAAH